jgi:hypothetical protein
MFSQQHYEVIANTIGSRVMQADKAGDTRSRQIMIEYLNDLIEMFEKDNPKFKKLRFIEAALGKANAAYAATKKE